MGEASFNEALKEAYGFWRRSPGLASVGLLHQAAYGLSSSFSLGLLLYLLGRLPQGVAGDVLAKLASGGLAAALDELLAQPSGLRLLALPLLSFAALWLVAWALAYAFEYPAYAQGLQGAVRLGELAPLARRWLGRLLLTNIAYELVASAPLFLVLALLLASPPSALPLLLPGLALSLLLRWALCYSFPACALDGATGFRALRLGLRALRRLLAPSLAYALTRAALLFLLLTLGLASGFLGEGGFIVVAMLYCPLISLVHYAKVVLYASQSGAMPRAPPSSSSFASWLRGALPCVLRGGARELAAPRALASYALGAALLAALLGLKPWPGLGISPAELAAFPGLSWGLSLYLVLSGPLLLLPSLPALLLGLEELASAPYAAPLRVSALALLALSLGFSLRLGLGFTSGRGAAEAYRGAVRYLLLASLAYLALAVLRNIVLPLL
ncbi:MAG: hypothetical protein C4339_01905 [Nitrososphaerota archaeon]